MTTHQSVHPPTAALQGISHLGLTVADARAARNFWTEVMGFEVTGQDEVNSLLLHRAGRVAIGLTDHGGTARAPFDHRQVGLDHVALAVENVAVLEEWAARLDLYGVQHTGITKSDAGHHLNFRAPDDVPIELFAIGFEMLEALGLTGPAAAVANTHALPDADG